METEYTSVLIKKLEALRGVKDRKAIEIKGLLSEIEIIQKSIDNIIQLLKFEGVELDQQLVIDVTRGSISDLAFAYLNSQSAKQPKHYLDLYNGIIASGKPIPGKNPAANLLTHMIRDDRFVRVSSGTYALSKWGIEVPNTQRKKKTQSTTKKRTSK